ncbi:MAG: hypothetical protein CL610_20285 [Anaerolineaceae bacterium]|nr:hypothetical protein [Anaerolineaceae bacterium]
MNARQLFEQGEEKLDKGDTLGAIAAYRQSATLMETPWSLEGFKSAQDYERLQFLRELKTRHPESLIVWIAYAKYFEDTNLYPRAVQIYTEILDLFGSDLENELNIRGRRLVAACHLHHSRAKRSCIIEDLRRLWLLGESFEVARRPRFAFVARLLGNLLKPEDADVLQKLSQDELFPDSVRELFRLRSRELQMLGTVLDELKIPLESG